MIYKGLRLYRYKYAERERRWVVQKTSPTGWAELHRCPNKDAAVAFVDKYLYDKAFEEARA